MLDMDEDGPRTEPNMVIARDFEVAALVDGFSSSAFQLSISSQSSTSSFVWTIYGRLIGAERESLYLRAHHHPESARLE